MKKNFGKTFVCMFLAFVMLFALTACGSSSAPAASGSSGSESGSDTIKIGGIGALTGGYANYGLSVQHGAQLAVDEINAAGGVNEAYRPGDIMVIPSGVVHEIHTPPTGHRYYFLLDRERLFIIDGLLAAEEALQPCMVIRKGSAPEIEQRVKTAAAEAGGAQDRFGLTVARLELSRMLIDLLRRHAQEHGTELNRRTRHKEQTQMLFVDIRDYVMAHCAENLTPQNMADKSGYSRYHFERLFYDCLGISFHEFLTRQRLTLCKQLLERTDDSITSIAGQSGFGSIATFNRVFQQYEGMSPSAYRKSGTAQSK